MLVGCQQPGAGSTHAGTTIVNTGDGEALLSPVQNRHIVFATGPPNATVDPDEQGHIVVMKGNLAEEGGAEEEGKVAAEVLHHREPHLLAADDDLERQFRGGPVGGAASSSLADPLVRR